MSRKALIVTLAAQGIVLALLLTVALDQYVHAKTDSIDGVNHRGYRGDVAFQHSGKEARLMMAGGARAFGAGVILRETTLMRLQAKLAQQGAYPAGPITAFNVAAPGPRESYAERLQRFRDLTPDIVCISVDLGRVPQQRTGLLARAGYVPALAPAASIDSLLGSLLPSASTTNDDITAVADAVTLAVSMSRGTVVAVPEPSTVEEQSEHAALMQALRQFSGDPRVRVVAVPNSATAGTSLEDAVAAELVMPVREFLSQMTAR